MTSRAERVFLPALREVERRLQVPLPRRMRILRELEYDLEQMRAGFLSRGMSPEEAHHHAIEALVPDAASLSALGRLHAPLYRRATRGIAADRLRALERWALVTAALAVVLTETLLLLRAGLLRDPSPFLWPVLGLGALLFAFVVAGAFHLWVKADGARTSAGLSWILALSAVTVGAGVGGTLADFYRLSATLERTPALASTLVTRWLVRDASLMAAAILIGLAGALAWLVLTQWLTLVAEARLELLGLARHDESSNGR